MRTRPSRWPHCIAAVVLSSAVIAGSGVVATGVEVALVLLASACTLDLVRREARAPGNPVPIACSIAVLFGVAVIFPPQFSYDLWSYAIAGRILAVHHANPYLHSAGSYGHDPFLRFVAPLWRHGTTPYGPLFTLHAAAIALIGGSHPLLYRLAFQGSVAVAIGVALFVLWRTTRSTSALALLGLHPVIASSVVNGGHNDAFVGLGLLLAVVSARRERYGRSGSWLAAALLVKATAGLALLPLMAWVWTRGRWRAIAKVAAAPLLVAMPLMLFTPGMMRSLRNAKTDVVTRASIWNLPLRLFPEILPHVPRLPPSALVSLALVLVLALTARATWVARRVGDPGDGVIAATAAWLVFGAYVLPAYTIWALPTAASLGRSRLTWLVAIQGMLATAVFVIPRTSLGTGSAIGDTVHVIVPIALGALFVWAVVPAVRGTRGRRRDLDLTVT